MKATHGYGTHYPNVSPEYSAYSEAKQRCTNPHNQGYQYYVNEISSQFERRMYLPKG